MRAVFAAEALAGKAGIVTGAASGIGRETVKALVAAGAAFAVADRDEHDGYETVELARAPGTAAFVSVDVTDATSVAAMVERSVELHGRLDFAHNKAGIIIAGPLMADVPTRTGTGWSTWI